MQVSAPLDSPSVYSKKVLEQFGIKDLKDIPHIKDFFNFSGDGDMMTFPDGPFTNEYDLNCQYYGELARVFGRERLFNTETNNYLPTSDNPVNDKKPDWLIFECASFLDMKPKPPIFSSEEICYAVPPMQVLEFVTAILEAKTGRSNLNLTELEPLFTYLALFLREKHPNPRGILYNEAEFIYAEYSTDQGGLTFIARSEWSFPGCKEFLQSRLQPNPVLENLKHAVPFTLGRFLGKGRFGFVLEASTRSESFALKFVKDTSYFDMFEKEFSHLCKAYEAAPDVVIRPAMNSLVISIEYGLAYYLMSEVGIPSPELYRRPIFVLLCSLHLKNIVHGDPRIQNLVKVDGKLKWVDMRDMGEFSVANIESDMRCTIQSCFVCSQSTIDENPAILRKLQNYCEGVSNDKVIELYELCSKFL